MLGRGQPGVGQQRAELPPVLGQVDRLRAGAHHRRARGGQAARQAQRRLPAELDDHPGDRPAGLLGVQHLQHVLQGERLEVEPAGGVVVGGHGLRVAVDHHGLVPGRGQREGGVHARVVELDALPDPVRPAAQDDHLGPVARRAPRSARRRSSTGTGCAPRTRPRRCPRCGTPGGSPARAGGAGPRFQLSPRSRRSGRRRTRHVWPRGGFPRARASHARGVLHDLQDWPPGR